MSSFSRYFNNNFAGCRLIAYARDNHRNRDVAIYLMPGNVADVGVTDGVDKWICPVIANPFSVNVPQLVRDILAGKSIPTPTPMGERQDKRRPRKIIEEPISAPTRRRALLSDPTAPNQTKARRVLFS